MKAGRFATYGIVIGLCAAALTATSVSYALVGTAAISGSLGVLGPICGALDAASTLVGRIRRAPHPNAHGAAPQERVDQSSLPDLLAGMPPVVDPSNLYSETGAGKLSPAVAGALPRVCVPDVTSNDVYVIDPSSLQVVDHFRVGANPQHVIPSWDLKKLWVASSTPS